jgi:hypothetical protein
MTVQQIYIDEKVLVGRPKGGMKDIKSGDLMIQGVLFNCSARIERTEQGYYEPKGNCTEQGLIRYL